MVPALAPGHPSSCCFAGANVRAVSLRNEAKRCFHCRPGGSTNGETLPYILRHEVRVFLSTRWRSVSKGENLILARSDAVHCELAIRIRRDSPIKDGIAVTQPIWDHHDGGFRD